MYYFNCIIQSKSVFHFLLARASMRRRAVSCIVCVCIFATTLKAEVAKFSMRDAPIPKVVSNVQDFMHIKVVLDPQVARLENTLSLTIENVTEDELGAALIQILKEQAHVVLLRSRDGSIHARLATMLSTAEAAGEVLIAPPLSDNTRAKIATTPIPIASTQRSSGRGAASKIQPTALSPAQERALQALQPYLDDCSEWVSMQPIQGVLQNKTLNLKHRILPYVRLAMEFQKLLPNDAMAILEHLANLGSDERRDGPYDQRISVLCQMLYESKNSTPVRPRRTHHYVLLSTGKTFSVPLPVNPQIVALRNLDRKSPWVSEPLVMIDDFPFSIAKQYPMGDGQERYATIPDFARDYLNYIKTECRWTTRKYRLPTSAQLEAAYQKLIAKDSPVLKEIFQVAGLTDFTLEEMQLLHKQIEP
jgi:hypothetical protein